MRFDDLNWMDVEQYLKQDDRLMLVLGACEQHAYLSLATDVRIPQALADAASKQSGILVTPALAFGSSPYFMKYQGTISLRISTLMDILEDMVRSVYAHGFRRLLVVNGHGGNNPAMARLRELMDDLPGLNFRWYSWWLSTKVKEIAAKNNLPTAHASWMEAFPFTRVCDMPDGSKAIFPEGSFNAVETRRLAGDGNLGGPYCVDDTIMDEVFEACLKEMLDLLKFK